ncbi:thiamine biosynthesis protein ApbE [Methylomonas lenta]|uniref:FAD:protein FMN transferase n=1 Tax=Methylomonas lenta TaxID=980561 RepID=A0A177N1H1_9GAMM|nr:FAD:protein FMN transferase [Methylomonas lenta]OAI11732.1 thiamine biosynthesis protein ApbE [Methylomonas lenta]
MTNPYSSFLVSGICLLALFGCSEPKITKFEGITQGTSYHISYWSPNPLDGKTIQTEVNARLASIDKTFSNYRSDSVIESFNNNPINDSQWVGDEIVALFNIARDVSQASQGCYDLTIKPLFDLWGFQGESLTIPDAATLQAALASIGQDKVSVIDDTHLQKPANIRVDVSSVAQGYSVEKISQLLEQHDIHNYLVEIGGELKTDGHKPDGTAWRIAVEKPLPGEQHLLKILTLPKDKPMAVMTSGTYRHYFDVNGQRYSHILDARTGKPVTHDLVAVTVLHDNPTIADAWSTALLCLGQQQGMQIADAAQIKALFIQQQGKELLETKSQALQSSGLSIE